MKTRTKKTQKNADHGSNKTAQAMVSSMPDGDSKPPSLTILPKDLSSEARILQIPSISEHESVKRILLCPMKGFFEFTSIEDTITTRSCLAAPEGHDDNEVQHDDSGYVLKRPEILIATPVDPLFIVLPLMLKATEMEESSYLACSDYVFGQEDASYADFKLLMRKSSFNNQLSHLEARVASISEQLDLGEDQDAMYRFSPAKLYIVLLSKAEKLAKNGLPASMEDKFVRQALQKPVIFTAADEAELQKQELAQQNLSVADTKAEISAESMSEEVDETTASIMQLQRIKIAFEYLTRAYVPQSLHATFNNKLLTGSSPDFAPLMKLEEEIKQLKQQSQALRTLSDNISRKRAIDDEEAMERAGEKRRKKDEEEKKKKPVSHGIKQLAKADTSGMKKLSSFFAKKPVK
ncbi:hypothetical protein MRB53_040082 [Persea americana]|nr:hypothetical protein MRB53_040082 [Persea americana]